MKVCNLTVAMGRVGLGQLKVTHVQLCQAKSQPRHAVCYRYLCLSGHSVLSHLAIFFISSHFYQTYKKTADETVIRLRPVYSPTARRVTSRARNENAASCASGDEKA